MGPEMEDGNGRGSARAPCRATVAAVLLLLLMAIEAATKVTNRFIKTENWHCAVS